MFGACHDHSAAGSAAVVELRDELEDLTQEQVLTAACCTTTSTPQTRDSGSLDGHRATLPPQLGASS